MDEIDRAQVVEEDFLDGARDRQRRRVASHAVNRGIVCFGCGEDIPPARRRALPGCCLCIACQEDAERAMGR